MKDNNEIGTSASEAIVVRSIGEEYVWIKHNYPEFQLQKQAMTYVDDKPYDILIGQDAEGKEIKIYFDISKFFGKR